MALKIDYKLVGTGWAQCTVRPARRNYTITVSYDSDALEYLVLAALSGLSQVSSISFVFFSNSADWQWIIEHQTHTDLSIEILEVRPQFFGVIGEAEVSQEVKYEYKPLIKFTCTAVSFAQSVHTAAAGVLKEHGPKGYKELWAEHEFPIELLKLLSKRLTALKNDA